MRLGVKKRNHGSSLGAVDTRSEGWFTDRKLPKTGGENQPGGGDGVTWGKVQQGADKASWLAKAAVSVWNAGKSLFGGKNYSLNRRNYQSAPNDRVTIFNDTQFNGSSRSFAPGEFVWLGKGGRDKISSVKVPPGLKLEVWTGRHPDTPEGNPGDDPGRKATWTSDQVYVGDEWNDHIDTIRVSRTSQGQQGGRGGGMIQTGLGSTNTAVALGAASLLAAGGVYYWKNYKSK